MAMFEYTSSLNKGDPAIVPRSDYKGPVKYLLIAKDYGGSYGAKDVLWYMSGKEIKRFDIFEYLSSDSMRSGFPSDKRLAGFEMVHLARLSGMTKIPLEELVEIQNIEREKIPKIFWT